MRDWMVRALILPLCLPALAAAGQVTSASELSGTLQPSGPPVEPVRRQVGSACVVDLVQGYDLKGSLVGKMKIDYRIFVAGDCTQPPGTFDENWIAYGTYAVRIGNAKATGALIYLAAVKAGGRVQGTLTLDGGLPAQLEVVGNFKDGYLSYASAQTDPASQ